MEEIMDHKEQHHQKHQKEREREKKQEKLHEREQERKAGYLHPGWFLALGVVLLLLAVLVWTFLLN